MAVSAVASTRSVTSGGSRPRVSFVAARTATPSAGLAVGKNLRTPNQRNTAPTETRRSAGPHHWILSASDPTTRVIRPPFPASAGPDCRGR
jgi:hypothetical protein